MTGNANGILHLHYEMKARPTLGNPWAFGLIWADTQWGYMPQNAGNACAASAAAYGYYNPALWYGNQSGLCWPACNR